jgi:uncharacterized protein (DUF58 family)
VKTPFLLVLSLIFGMIVLGLATLQSGALILAIPLITYLFAAMLQRPEAIRLTVTREISPDYAPQGTPITVKLTITNQGSAIDELVLQDVLPNGVRQIGGKSSSVSFLTMQGEVKLEYTIEAQRGEYRVYEMLVYARDFLGFFEQPLVYRTAPRFVIHPRYPKLDRIKIRPPQTRGFAGPIAARQGGTGIDFWGVREYQPSDPQRQINWKLTARSESELYTNLFEQERVADVGLILDARERTNVMTHSDSLFEHSARAAAALAENFLDDGNRVSLLVYGSGIARVFPGYGRVQHDRILRELAKATPGMNYALESLTHLPTRLFPAKSQLVLVSPLVPEDIPVIVRMRAHGYAVMVISPDPIAYESALHRDSISPAYRIASAERNFMLRQVRQSGVQIVNWQVTQPLETAIREALARQPLVVRNYRVGIG